MSKKKSNSPATPARPGSPEPSRRDDPRVFRTAADSLYFRMTVIPDHNRLPPGGLRLPHKAMDPGDIRAGGIHDAAFLSLQAAVNAVPDAMGTNDHSCAFGDLIGRGCDPHAHPA